MKKVTTARGVLLGGLSSGLIAGAAMALVLMFYGWAKGMGFFAPMQLIAGTFYGLNARELGPESAAVGILFHLFNSAVIGLMFAAFVRYSSAVTALIFGVLLSLLIWAVTTFVAVPLLDAPLRRTLPTMQTTWLLAHLIFGTVLMITPALVSRFSSSEDQRPAGMKGHRRVA